MAGITSSYHAAVRALFLRTSSFAGAASALLFDEAFFEVPLPFDALPPALCCSWGI